MSVRAAFVIIQYMSTVLYCTVGNNTIIYVLLYGRDKNLEKNRFVNAD